MFLKPYKLCKTYKFCNLKKFTHTVELNLRLCLRDYGRTIMAKDEAQGDLFDGVVILDEGIMVDYLLGDRDFFRFLLHKLKKWRFSVFFHFPPPPKKKWNQ